MKKHLYTLLTFVSLLTTTNIYADYETRYATKMAEVISYVNQQGDAIWPNFKIDNPVLIYFQNSQHSYAFNFNPHSPAWQPMISGYGKYYFLGTDNYGITTFKYDKTKELPYLTIDDQKTLIIQEYIPVQFQKNGEQENNEDKINKDINNSVREFIGSASSIEIGSSNTSDLPATVDQCFANDFIEDHHLNIILALRVLEVKVLIQYLNNNKNEEDLKNYLAIEKYRSNQLTACQQASEKSWLKYDGTWQYVSYRSLNLDEQAVTAALLDQAHQQLRFLEFATKMSTQELTDDLNTFSLTLFITPTIDYVLDKVSPAWKTDYIASNGATTPMALLRQHYAMTEDDINARVISTEHNFEFLQIYRKIEELRS